MRFVAVCNTLAYAHSRGVVHRDLKPANIFLGRFGDTLVVDWGLAKIIGRPVACSTEVTLRPPLGAGWRPRRPARPWGRRLI
jgi:serine/threonine protein kinase